jgi:hypothetical protein
MGMGGGALNGGGLAAEIDPGAGVEGNPLSGDLNESANRLKKLPLRSSSRPE